MGSWICWASCSFHRTFNYSRPQITSRIQASLSRLPPPHVNALLLLLMPPSSLSFPSSSPSPFGISADEGWTVSCLRVACFFWFPPQYFYFLISPKEFGWKTHKQRKHPQTSGSVSFKHPLLTRADDSCSFLLFVIHTWMILVCIAVSTGACMHINTQKTPKQKLQLSPSISVCESVKCACKHPFSPNTHNKVVLSVCSLHLSCSFCSSPGCAW